MDAPGVLRPLCRCGRPLPLVPPHEEQSLHHSLLGPATALHPYRNPARCMGIQCRDPLPLRPVASPLPAGTGCMEQHSLFATLLQHDAFPPYSPCCRRLACYAAYAYTPLRRHALRQQLAHCQSSLRHLPYPLLCTCGAPRLHRSRVANGTPCRHTAGGNHRQLHPHSCPAALQRGTLCLCRHHPLPVGLAPILRRQHGHGLRGSTGGHRHCAAAALTPTPEVVLPLVRPHRPAAGGALLGGHRLPPVAIRSHHRPLLSPPRRSADDPLLPLYPLPAHQALALVHSPAGGGGAHTGPWGSPLGPTTLPPYPAAYHPCQRRAGAPPHPPGHHRHRRLPSRPRRHPLCTAAPSRLPGHVLY